MNIPTKMFEGKAVAISENQAVAASVEGQRSTAELEAMVWLAHSSPRDEAACRRLALKICEEPYMAENGVYRYTRGSTLIQGGSIILASELCQIWGNIVSGVMQLPDDRPEYWTFRAHAVDLERNVWRFQTFEVSKLIQRKSEDGVTRWIETTDQRDLRERSMAVASVVERNCILRVLPGSLVRQCVDRCNETFATLKKIAPNPEKIKTSFASIGVTGAMLEEYLSKALGALTPDELGALRDLFGEIRDGNLTWAEAAARDAGEKGTAPERFGDVGQNYRGHGREAPEQGEEPAKEPPKGATKKASKRRGRPPKAKPDSAPEASEPAKAPEPPPEAPEGTPDEPERTETAEETTAEAPEAEKGAKRSDFTDSEWSEIRRWLLKQGARNDVEAAPILAKYLPSAALRAAREDAAEESGSKRELLF